MKNILLLLSLLVILFSCTKETGVTGPAGPDGPAGPAGNGPANDTGSIAGHVSLYNEFSYKEASAGGVIITLTSGDFKKTDTTDATGTYQFSGIKTGTYNLTFQKSAYGTMKVVSLSHFGGGMLATPVQEVALVQIPVKTAPDSVNGLTVIRSGAYTSFTIKLDTSSLQYVQNNNNFLLVFSKDKNISTTNYTYQYPPILYADGAGGYVAVTLSDGLSRWPFVPGDTVYGMVCTFNRYLFTTINNPDFGPFDAAGIASYIDPQTGTTVYPNLSKPGNVLKFVY